MHPIPCSLWRFSQLYRNYLPYCRTVVLMASKLFSRPYAIICPMGKLVTDSIAIHLVLFCRVNDATRQNMWKSFHNSLGHDTYTSLTNMYYRDQIIEMLSGFSTSIMSESQRVQCFKLMLRYMHHLAKCLNYLLM